MIDSDEINNFATATSTAFNWLKAFSEIYEYKRLHWSRESFLINYKNSIIEGTPDFSIDRTKYESGEISSADILGEIYKKNKPGNHNKIVIKGTPPIPIVFELSAKMEYLKIMGNLNVKPIIFYGKLGKLRYKRTGSASESETLSIFVSETRMPSKEEKDLMFVPVDKNGKVKIGRNNFSKKTVKDIAEEIKDLSGDSKYKILKLSIQSSPKVVSLLGEFLASLNIEIQITHYSQKEGKEVVMKRIKY